MLSRCFILSLICNILIAQLSISGSLKPSGMFRISDHSRIDLPFRIAELELGYTMGDFDFMLNSAVEYRWGENNYVFELNQHMKLLDMKRKLLEKKLLTKNIEESLGMEIPSKKKIIYLNLVE